MKRSSFGELLLASRMERVFFLFCFQSDGKGMKDENSEERDRVASEDEMDGGLSRLALGAGDALEHALVAKFHGVDAQRVLAGRAVFVAVADGGAVLEPLDARLWPWPQ